MKLILVLAACAALCACDRSSSNPPAQGMPGGQPMGGQPMGGQPMGGQPMGGQPMGGQPMGGQPMGGNPMPPQGGPPSYGAPQYPQNSGAQPSQVMPNGALPSEEYVDEDDTGGAPPGGGMPNGAPPNGAPPTAAPPNAPAPDGAQTFDLKPLRTIDALDPNKPPPADGDFTTWKAYSRNGDTCGALYKTTPFEAIFIICAGVVVVGPLSDPVKIQGAFAEMQQQIKAHFSTMASMSEFANNLRRNMQANWPSGCSNCRVRVYDSRGNWLRDEN